MSVIGGRVIWEADLIGDTFDLTELVQATKGKDPSVIKTANGFGLRYSEFDSLASYKEVQESAAGMVKLLSGMCKVLISTRIPLGISGITRYMPDGTRHCFNTVEERLSVRGTMSMTVTGGDGTVAEIHQADPVIRWLLLARRYEPVAKAFRLFGDPQLGWVTLYKIYELIESDVGGPKAITKAGWTSQSTISRFKHSANSPSVGGDDARHGTETTTPPSKPMDLAEARVMIKMMMHNWLRNKP